MIQTYGFDPTKFYLDGPNSFASAYPGRAFLREGILVLALPTRWSPATPRDELITASEGIEAAVDQLAREGKIDPNRVGIIGFSATGSLVNHVITFSEARIRAATIADSWSNTLFGMTSYLFGSFSPGMQFAEGRLESRPFGESTRQWAERDPSFHTDCIEAAVRFEYYGEQIIAFWDIYALLRRQYKPTEMLVFPNGEHQLSRPSTRISSLQGNVDWFKFWLNDEEDPDPRKEDQYTRWRFMRDNAPRTERRAACTPVA